MEQLYARGKPICPKSGYDDDNAAEKIKALEDRAGRMQMILDEIVDRVANRLLERAEIAEWARQAVKPYYTAEEVGADGKGSARNALLEAKEYSDGTYRQSVAYTDQKIAELTGGADDTLDTLGELADAIRNNETVVTALHNAIGNKASDVELQAHISNGTVHVTFSEKSGWNDAVAKIVEIMKKLDGIEDGANRLTTTTSLLATKPGTALDATAAPVIIEKIDSQSSDFTKALDRINDKLITTDERLTTVGNSLDAAGLKVTTGTAGIVSYAKWGKIVSVSCSKNYTYDAANRMKWLTIATLPGGYRPKTETAGTLNAFSAAGWFRIGTNGVVAIISESTASATEPVRFSATFIAA